MTAPSNPKPNWRFARRLLIALAVFATLIAIFYTEEDWRGKQVWEHRKQQLEAQGMVLDWDQYTPPRVPDDQNFFKAPKMAEWFQKDHLDFAAPFTNELSFLVTNADRGIVISNQAAAAKFLAWSDPLQPDFDLIRDALKRPCEREDGDYSEPVSIPMPNFVDLRDMAQVLARRTESYLQLDQPEKALAEVTLLNDMRRITEREPTGRPMTLVDAMINVAVAGLYAETVGRGIQNHQWQEPQLATLQEQLGQINLPPFVALAFQCEAASNRRTLETMPLPKLEALIVGNNVTWWLKLKEEEYALAPRGWVYRNLAIADTFVSEYRNVFDAQNNLIQPASCEKISHETHAVLSHTPRAYIFIIAQVEPNFTRAWQRTAYNQTRASEDEIACALERCRLANGDYPDSLDALAPGYLQSIPHDIINGQPLHYRRTGDGKFLLYSVGWNERDDGGRPEGSNTAGNAGLATGDWVWPGAE